MAKTKKQLIEDLAELGIMDVDTSMTVADLTSLLAEKQEPEQEPENTVEEDAEEVIEEVVEEIKAEKGLLKKKVSREELSQLEKDGKLVGNTSIIDGFCVATFKE